MIDVLLPGVMLVGIATLIVAVGALRSSRRSEGLGEDRYELLRNQHEQLEILREERQVLVEELKRESRERQHLMKTLEEARPRLVEDVEGVRREHGEAERQAEQQEHERARLQHELKRLEEELERERRGHSEVQQRAEQQEQERLRLEGELERSEAQVEKRIAELEASQKVTPAPEGREAPTQQVPTKGARSRLGRVRCPSITRTRLYGPSSLSQRQQAWWRLRFWLSASRRGGC